MAAGESELKPRRNWHKSGRHMGGVPVAGRLTQWSRDLSHTRAPVLHKRRSVRQTLC